MFSKKICVIIIVALLIVSLSPTLVSRSLGASAAQLPVVAIHVSGSTEANWAHTVWTYYSLPKMLEAVLSSDGTPYVELTDQAIESGALLASGAPKYPILFCVASESISDLAASQIRAYVAAGGFVYVTASSWTKQANGAPRSDFALSAEMGLTRLNPPPNNWVGGLYVTKTADNRLVNHIPAGVSIEWRLPTTKDTLPLLSGEQHILWQAKPTASNPAEVLATIDGNVMLATKAYSQGRFIYHSELAPLAGYGVYAPDTYEYVFFKNAIEWAFESSNMPLTRLSPWPYAYDSAFIVRHDLDFSMNGVQWIVNSTLMEQSLGVVGQYYVVTGDVNDASNKAFLVSQLQQAQGLGAEIGSHNGGFNCSPWAPYLKYGDWAFYHWGSDEAIAYHPSGKAAGISYASDSINKSLSELQTWLGQRPTIFASPAGRGCLDESMQILESLGIKTTGDLNIGPFPYMAFSLTTKGKTYDILQVPTGEWINSSGAVLQTLEEHSSESLRNAVDFYYDIGALVGLYSHSSSQTGIPLEYIQYAKSKPNMWAATPMTLREWWLTRQQITVNPQYQRNPDGSSTLTLALNGTSSPDTAVEIQTPQLGNVEVLLNGVPSSNYRTTSSGIKIQTGMSTNVTLIYSAGGSSSGSFIQTSQADFQGGTLTNLDSTAVAGELRLARESGGVATLFSDDFENASWTSSHWTRRAGSWVVSDGLYRVVGASGEYSVAYAGNASWRDYVVEARVRADSGDYSAQVGGRFNPSTGARYALWLYPSEAGGPNMARLVRFTSWTSFVVLGEASVVTDNDWHVLRLEFNGSSVRCFFDGGLIISAVDSSLASGLVTFETWGSVAYYDWVRVLSFGSEAGYVLSGSIVSSGFDALGVVDWGTISWVGFVPEGTSVVLRTRSASSEVGLSSAVWSGYYVVNGSSVVSLPNRWLQYEAVLSTTNAQVTPILDRVIITWST